MSSLRVEVRVWELQWASNGADLQRKPPSRQICKDRNCVAHQVLESTLFYPLCYFPRQISSSRSLLQLATSLSSCSVEATNWIPQELMKHKTVLMHDCLFHTEIFRLDKGCSCWEIGLPPFPCSPLQLLWSHRTFMEGHPQAQRRVGSDAKRYNIHIHPSNTVCSTYANRVRYICPKAFWNKMTPTAGVGNSAASLASTK